ncbi:WPP domain-interacting protein 1-like [Musa acuminata AAA Group]|uniref:WPP domain-interacting protein 1-like n=1 Tax=Musa acuminata AAA Group TaxID=214697 RepID=UPI0031CEF3E2
MNSEESSKSRLEELGGENRSETTVKMAPLSEINAEFGGELGGEEPSGIDSPIGTGGADQIWEERGNVSPGEAVASSPGAVKVNRDPVGGEFLAESPSNSIGSPSSAAAEVVASKLAPSKGFGLKKWRRIRRDLNKDITGCADTAQILKRRLSLAEPSKAHEDNKHKSDGEDEVEGEGSVASSVSMNIGGPPFVVAPTTLDPELGLLVTATGFNIGIESESSDDHGSKSSTAASALRLRHETVGFGRDRSRARNVIGRVPGHVVQQRGQRPKGVRADVKKITENQVKIEMENSYSDLQSSNVAVFCTNSMASNGKQSEKSVNYCGEQSDDAQPSVEVRSGFFKENGGIGDVLRDDLDGEYSGGENKSKSQPLSDLDPFLESIDSLQAIKEALENEIQNFWEIGKDVLPDDYGGQYEETEGSSSPAVEVNLVEQNEKIEHLECKLGEALAVVRAKETKILELEAVLNRTERPNKESDSTDLLFFQEKCRDMEMELENLLEKKIEVEIKYTILARTTQIWRVLEEDHIALLEEQKSPSGDQLNMMCEVENAENKTFVSRGGAEELEKDLLAAEEVLKLQRIAYKYSLCFCVQIILLCIAFGLFLMQLFPSSSGVAPT